MSLGSYAHTCTSSLDKFLAACRLKDMNLLQESALYSACSVTRQPRHVVQTAHSLYLMASFVVEETLQTMHLIIQLAGQGTSFDLYGFGGLQRLPWFTAAAMHK